METVAFLTKLLPVIITAVSPLFAWTELGSIDVRTGTGFTTVNLAGADMPPPGWGLAAVISRYSPTSRSEPLSPYLDLILADKYKGSLNIVNRDRCIVKEADPGQIER